MNNQIEILSDKALKNFSAGVKVIPYFTFGKNSITFGVEVLGVQIAKPGQRIGNSYYLAGATANYNTSFTIQF